ncbi:hydantoinase B/oxoprolinase family protein [Bordetella pertussis]|uniref:hydantoinase B/oxoprolinase family protein n=1 Tax=Bordetella pertussis TaxID=520 RepID=UPI001EDDB3D0|nr:hydantoinase B/oxoprolinase family protein [Bordetella pertussis]
MVNPLAPAAVGMRSLTCKVVQYATMGVFSQVVPDRLPASPAGGMSIVNVKTTDRDGKTIIAAIEPVGAARAAIRTVTAPTRPGHRGVPAQYAGRDQRNRSSIRITRYGMVPDSGGPGRYRGGLGTCMEFQVYTPNSAVTARNRDRSRFASWGVLGGKAGTVSRFLRNPGTAHEEDLGVHDFIHCQPGDVIRLEGCGRRGLRLALGARSGQGAARRALRLRVGRRTPAGSMAWSSRAARSAGMPRRGCAPNWLGAIRPSRTMTTAPAATPSRRSGRWPATNA